MTGPAARPVVNCPAEPFNETLGFFTDTLGFRLEMITPADDPALALISLDGLTIRLDRTADEKPPDFTLPADTGQPSLRAPNGSRISFVTADDLAAAPEPPPLEPELVVARLNGDTDSGSSDTGWVTGRAGMRYRDLIPSRLGGRYIASHIEVCDGGPVPDMVHHHAICFQMIFCVTGWVDVVYEDQGPPFRMHAGDGVLQPPHIRHRVLESSAGAQVVEIGCPAEHDTLFDHALELPTPDIDSTRDFGGQRFVRFDGSSAAHTPWHQRVGWSAADTGIGTATGNLAEVLVVRGDHGAGWNPVPHDDEFHFVFVLSGTAVLSLDGEPVTVGDAVTVPAGTAWSFDRAGSDFSFLHVRVPELSPPVHT